MVDVSGFYKARSIAVVGASREENKVGHIVLKNLSSNPKLTLIPINPNAPEVLGKKCYPSIESYPGQIDLIVVCVKPELVPQVIRDAGAKKCKAAIIITAGFSEAGNGSLEHEVMDIAQRLGIAVLGPNVLGLIDPAREINASFFDGMPPKGNIAFISQSGAIGTAILDIAIKEGIGIAGFVSLGNANSTSFADFIDYYSSDKNTKVIGLYVESIKEGKGAHFIEACRRCKKPIIAIKSGKSAKGSKAAQSHTAALASPSGVYEGIFRQAGVIEVNNATELLRAAEAVGRYGRIGRRACIVTNAGGLGVLCTDYCSQNHIDVVELPDKVRDKLNKLLPPGWSRNNPIDLLGDALPDRYQSVMQMLDKEGFFDFFIVLLTPQYMTRPLETAQILLKVRKPVATVFMGGAKTEDAVKLLENRSIPCFEEAEEMAKSVGKIVRKE